MTTQELGEKIQPSNAQVEDEISLIELLTAIGEEKWIVCGFVFVCALAGVAMSLSMTNIYTAKTTFLPPQQTQSSAANALASLGGLAGLAGGALGIKSPDEMYVAMLGSVTLQNNLIARHKLQAVYEREKLSDTRAALNGAVRISPDKKSGIISIEVDDKSPVLAAEVANSFVEELRKILERLAVTDAQQRRIFFEKLIIKTKDALADAELKSKTAQETSGIVSLEGQALSAIKASAALRAQIALREVQIQAASSYATPQNADMQRLAAELAGLRAQLDRLEQGSSQKSNADKSANALNNLRAFREVKYQEAVLETLIRQYELARVEEAKEGPLIQQLDVATVPERRSRPKRAVIVMMMTLTGLLMGLATVFIKRGLRKSGTDPVLAARLEAMRQAWRIKKRPD